MVVETKREEGGRRVERAGVDLTAARDRGTYLAVDAAATARELMAADRLEHLGAVRTFALTRDAPAAARHFAVATVGRWGAGNLSDDVALVVTELAANAVRHAHSGFTVILSSRRNVLRIAVRDASPAEGPGPALTPAPLHGLGVVDAMAIRWGVESLRSLGKTVWAELSQ